MVVAYSSGPKTALEERSRLEQDRRKLEAEQQATEAAKRQAESSRRAIAAAPAAARPAPAAVAVRDGSYSGRLCNDYRSSAPKCWPVILVVRDGAIEASWLGATKKTSSARGTIAAGGAVQLQLNGWQPSGKPTEAKLLGTFADGAIKAAGKWMTGGDIAGEWKFAQAAAPKRAHPLDGSYDGQLCMQIRSKSPNCWPVALGVRNGVIEGTWLGRMNRTASARGTIAANGTLQLKLSAWTRDGTPIEGELTGRVAGDSMSASGRWSDNAEVSGNWTRKP
jgi:hypothetical protein